MSMKKLELGSVELAGMNLIEASAGTGKTYAIASLYLRLLLESWLLPEQILVVTYTEAATQELRSRIRSRIREGLDVLEGAGTGDPFLTEISTRAREAGTGREKGVLEQALAAFDTAAIFTIHGFSLRALQENAFESGSLYDTELVTDESELLREIVDDFWRHHFFSDTPDLLGFVLQQKSSPESFMKLLKGVHASGGGEIVPQFTPMEILSIEQRCMQRFNEISDLWRDEALNVQLLLQTDKGLSRSADNYRADLLPDLFDSMERFVRSANPYDLFTGFGKFTESGLAGGTKPKGSAPQHPLFQLCESLNALVFERFVALKFELIVFYHENMPLRKRARNVRFFDDLLADLYHALDSEELASVLRTQYRAALIDEFQDTDPVQYEIFRKIYAGSGAPLFLIGDPKQAIYSFRGADIFAYLRAAEEVEENRRFTLTSNWRSDSSLLDAFNTIFHQQRLPFLFEGIVYHPLTPGESREASGAVERQEGAGERPMQICLMDPGNESGTFTTGSAERFAAEACASEIEQLLSDGFNGSSFPPDCSLNAGDIAVIVRTHRQARMVQSTLRSRGISGVMRSDESIFVSSEAEEVRILLAALSDPGAETLVRTALVTDILGLSGNDIDRLNRDETLWIPCLERFHRYHRIWLERGFMAMASEFMSNEAVRARLLRFSDGERRLTNVLHCFELLHREAEERRLGIEALASWFSERIAAGESADEYQIRLESDEAAVRIVTVHVSKGLEYPVVFAPFLFGGINAGKDVVQFHDEKGKLVKDFGSGTIAENRSAAEKEALAENLRLLYVALTRAKYRCYLFSARVVDGRKKESTLLSPLTYLFHASEEAKRSPVLVRAVTESIRALGAGEMAMQLTALAEASGGSIGVRTIEAAQALPMKHLPASGGEEMYTPVVHSFRGQIERLWRVSSFTSFSRHEPKAAELPDRDDREGAMVQAVPQLNGERSIFSFPRGAGAGIMMHSIFEKLDFASPSGESIALLAEQSLARHGYAGEWLPVLLRMITDTLNTPLSTGNGFFTLGALKPRSWVTELEFFFPLRQVSAKALGEVLKRYCACSEGVDLLSVAGVLDFREVKGMLMGFIDMVFEHEGRYYLLDWKSNHLGNSVEEYRSDSLRRAMQENLYPLQYLLYIVALNRYLALRVAGYTYASHFGGVIYIFLRGVSPQEGESAGFFRDLPSAGLIEALTDILIEDGEDER
ncbi:exodeoxyribonuclease V subunit beta [Chlorobium sp. KB01]|uniref:exodeoxyribonuclease V subunit beta n=1 Tax=Chlorobium sp. KB01 TaxID=1917528 RepID=UPI000975F66C|nr:exodeoxyribonuclease V subunit beta [Chlorobium sp. KB01]